MPGHMQKARLAIAKYAKVLDCYLLVLDSRAPDSTWDSRLAARFQHKLVVVLNRAALANPEQTGRWVEHFTRAGFTALAVDAKAGTGMGKLRAVLESKAKGKKPLHVAVTGLPNTGKSTILNSLLGRKASKVENRPGVTRGPQWVKVGNLVILDTPGVLTASSDLKSPILAALGIVASDSEPTASWLVARLLSRSSGALTCFGLASPPEPGQELSAIAEKQGWLRRGAQPDYARTSQGVLAAFQSGKMGRWTLEEIR